MRITVEVTITAYRADGTSVQVSNSAKKQAGDNPRFAGDEAAEVADSATKASLSGFRAAMEPESTVVEAAPSPQPSTPAWLEPSQPPATEADLRRKLRDYTVNALDTAGVDPELNPDHARQVLRAAGLKTYATDAELEAFQALRRQIRDGAP